MSDNTETLRILEERLGEHAFRILLDECGGTSLYIPTFESIERDRRNDSISAKFTGANYQELADLYGLTARQIRNIIN